MYYQPNIFNFADPLKLREKKIESSSFPFRVVRFPDSDWSPASFVHWMGKPEASESGLICSNTMVLILASAFPEPLLQPS